MAKNMKKTKQKFNFARLVPLLLLGLGAGVFFYFDGPSYIGLDTLKEHKDNLTALVEQLGIFAPIIYGAIYAVVVALSLPLGSVLTITAGFLFGIVVGTASVVLGATIGASILFIAINMGFGQSLGGESSGWVKKIQEGFNRNAFSYLVALRLVPVFPFAVVNIAASLVGMPLSTYFFATLIGIIPGSFVYILLGNGLGAIFDAGGTPNLSIIFEPQIIAPIVGLAALVLLQVAYRHVQEKKKANESKAAGSKVKAKSKPATKKKTSTRKPAKRTTKK